MKRRKALGSMPLLLLATALLGSTEAQAQRKDAATTGPCQIATIQRDSALVKLKDYPTQAKMLEAYQKQLQSEFDFKKLQFDTALQAYQQKEQQLTDAQRQEAVQALQQQERELQDFAQQAQEKLAIKEQELFVPLNERLTAAMASVAQQRGHAQVMDMKLLYFSMPSCDITQLVIDKANGQ